MKSRNAAVVTAIAAVLVVATIAAISIATPENVFAYKNQAASQASECGNGEFMPINIGCQNTGSQIQGDENAAALTAQQTFPEVNLPPKKATLNVFKEVICPDGLEDVCPTPSEFTINVAGNNPNPSSFPGSSMGTAVSLEPGMYEVTEMSPVTPTGLIALDPVFSADCTGDIQAGQELSCTITNKFSAAQPYASVQQIPCIPGQDDENIRVTYGGFPIGSFVGFIVDGVYFVQPVEFLYDGQIITISGHFGGGSHTVEVYEDQNFNGVFDADEPLTSASFTLIDCVIPP